jgi:hypothetical protein
VRLFVKIIVIGLLLVTAALWIRADDYQWLQDVVNQSGNSSQNNEPTNIIGVRGLEESAGSLDTLARDYAAIDRLEKISLSQADIEAFRREGGLR